MKTPAKLQKGDTVAIISPASTVNSKYIDSAAESLTNEGFKVKIMPHAKGPASGSYAASDDHRLQDFIEAYSDPEVRAILCARGGYGCNHLLGRFPEHIITHDPKWLIGFSDVTALHEMMLRNGVLTLHAPMAKHLATLPNDHYCTKALLKILKEGPSFKYEIDTHPLSRHGKAEGILVGGNLAVFNGLADTPYDPLRIEGSKILFIEDVSEPIYAVERMLIRLLLSGRMKDVSGIIVGHFTEYKPDRNFTDMESMIADLLARYPIRPVVAFGFPAGHTNDNLPLVLGADATLEVNPRKTTVTINTP